MNTRPDSGSVICGDFTVGQAAKRWRCSLELAEEFLSDFAAAGFVIEHTSGADHAIASSSVSAWSVTPKGFALACSLSMADDREPVT